MLITRLKLDYFGKFSGREIELKPGINIIYGENEAGKSTLHAFIKGMLFGIERLRGRGAASKEDTYNRYLPWDYPGAYGGQMDIKVGEKIYRLQRSFHANDRYFMVTDQETGREVKLKEGHISELIPGLNEATFRNTISIEQLRAQTDAGLASQVRNYITNLSIAKSREVDVDKAFELLKQKKKALESVPYELELMDLAGKIKEGEEREEKIDSLTADLKDAKAKKAGLLKQLDILKSSGNQKEEKLMDELPAILEKYRAYDGYYEEYSRLKRKTEDLKIQIKEKEFDAAKADDIRGDLNEARILDAKRAGYGEKLQSLYKEQEEKIRNNKKKGQVYAFAAAFTAAFAAMAAYAVTRSFALALGILLVLSSIGGIIYISYKKHVKMTDMDNDIKEAKDLYTKAEAKINQILTKHQTASLVELAKKQEECLKTAVLLDHDRESLNELNKSLKALEDKCDELHDAIMLYIRNFITEEELTPQAMARLQDAINLKKKETEANYSRLNSELDAINLKIEKINWELSSMEDNEDNLIKNRTRYEELMQKQKENETEITAINLAIDTIKELSDTIHDSFGKELNREVSNIISGVTNGKYQDLKVYEDLNIKLDWNDKLVMLDRLSAGTIDQVYFALRLAVADMLLGKDTMPLLLDDSFALYDDIRIKEALKLIADRSQVLIFSCQMREKTLLQEMGLPFNLIEL